MSKVVYIGDIHGRDVWKEIVKKHSDADTFVFIGITLIRLILVVSNNLEMWKTL